MKTKMILTAVLALWGWEFRDGGHRWRTDAAARNPAQADFFDLRAASVGIVVGQRSEFQPVGMVSQGPNGSSSALQATAEVFDTLSGRA